MPEWEHSTGFRLAEVLSRVADHHPQPLGRAHQGLVEREGSTALGSATDQPCFQRAALKNVEVNKGLRRVRHAGGCWCGSRPIKREGQRFQDV